MKRSIKRLLPRSVVLSVLMGLSGVLFWLAVGEVDEFCRLRTDGGGLYVLDDYGPNVRCDLRIDMVLLGTTVYAAMLFPLSLFLVYVGRSAMELSREIIERRR